jgi:hypothetical protein
LGAVRRPDARRVTALSPETRLPNRLEIYFLALEISASAEFTSLRTAHQRLAT